MPWPPFPPALHQPASDRPRAERLPGAAFDPKGRDLWAFSFHPTEGLALLQIGDEAHYSLFVTRRDAQGAWSEPTPWPLALPGAEDSDPCFSPDGTQLTFASRRRPEGMGLAGHFDLWVVDYTAGTWGRPRWLGPSINSDRDEYLPSVARNGDLYFERGGDTSFDLYVARRTPSGFAPATPLPAAINTSADEESPFIHPDGRTLLFVRGNVLMQSRLGPHGWETARPLHLEERGRFVYSPVLSPDGRWLLYTSNAGGRARILRVPYADVQPRP